MAIYSVNATEYAVSSAVPATRAQAPKQQSAKKSDATVQERPSASESKARTADHQDAGKAARINANARIRLDETGRRQVVQILDENREVVRQYPPDALLRVFSRFRRLQGILFDEQG